jgi:hypothetical protein
MTHRYGTWTPLISAKHELRCVPGSTRDISRIKLKRPKRTGARSGPKFLLAGISHPHVTYTAGYKLFASDQASVLNYKLF